MLARFALLVAWIFLTTYSVSAQPTTQPTASARETLIAEIEAARDQVNDLTVTTNARITSGAPKDAFSNYRVTAVLKGRLAYIDEQYGKADTPHLFARLYSYDGNRTTILPPDREGIIQPGRSDELRLMSRHFFILNMYDPINHVPGDLLTFLQSPMAHVRSGHELLEKRRCVVVDHMAKGVTTPLETVWLDA
ncbi:MAG TPA: hypothetical protein VK968_16360, partial [Roseimicrobium sp.]|nr:hypothetical protein [Roseimicrobium sp.]